MKHEHAILRIDANSGAKAEFMTLRQFRPLRHDFVQRLRGGGNRETGEYEPDLAKTAHGAICTVVLTIAPRSSVRAMNHVLASAGGFGAEIVFPSILAATVIHLRFERRPVSVV